MLCTYSASRSSGADGSRRKPTGADDDVLQG